MVTVCHEATGTIRATVQCAGKPEQRDCEYGLLCAMASPMAASDGPFRPSVVLVAHRWGEAVFGALEPQLQGVGIHAIFETAEAARSSAAQHGTDPNGLNY